MVLLLYTIFIFGISLFPFSIFLVFLCFVVIRRTYTPRHRLLITVVLPAIIALALQLIFEPLPVVQNPVGNFVIMTLIGYAACWIVAVIIFGSIKLLDTAFWMIAGATVLGIKVRDVRRRRRSGVEEGEAPQVRETD
jgi:hypothetical protein